MLSENLTVFPYPLGKSLSPYSLFYEASFFMISTNLSFDSDDFDFLSSEIWLSEFEIFSAERLCILGKAVSLNNIESTAKSALTSRGLFSTGLSLTIAF